MYLKIRYVFQLQITVDKLGVISCADTNRVPDHNF